MSKEEVSRMTREGTAPAPDDKVWVCGACGKTSRTQYGFDKNDKNVCDRGWDESCMMHAVLCYKEKDADGFYKAAP